MFLRKYFIECCSIKVNSDGYLFKKVKLLSVLVFDEVDASFLQLTVATQ